MFALCVLRAGMMQREVAFFDRVKARLRNRELYQEFLKCLNIFSQEIIGFPELNNLVSERGRAHAPTYLLPILKAPIYLLLFLKGALDQPGKPAEAVR